MRPLNLHWATMIPVIFAVLATPLLYRYNLDRMRNEAARFAEKLIGSKDGGSGDGGFSPLAKKMTWNPDEIAPRVISPAELSKHNTLESSWLVIMGEIFEVTRSEHYAPGAGYSIFVGRDASSAFITGDFNLSSPNQRLDDVSALEPHQMLEMRRWVEFYRTHETYAFLGVLVGRFYDEEGRRTLAWREALAKMEVGEQDRARKEAHMKEYPSCSSRWKQNEGGEVWCTGVGRVPRKYIPHSRCACVNLESLKPSDPAYKDFEIYPECPLDSSRCRLPRLDFDAAVREVADYIASLEARVKELEQANRRKAGELLELELASTNKNFEPVVVAEAVAKLEAAQIPWVSFEYFPPKTEAGVENLKDRMLRMKRYKPIYVDVTWGAGGSTSDTTTTLCIDAQRRGLTANMHLTCTNMPREKIDEALRVARANRIVNILALRGDPPAGQVDFKPVETGFSCALDLIKFLKATTGDEFAISCAGYPEGHPQRIRKVKELGRALTPSEASRVSRDIETGEEYVCTDADFEEEIAYLKAKVEAGAKMVVTQMFFDVQVYFDFVDACRAHGITVPIVPGIMCITNTGGFNRMVTFCRTRVPREVEEEMRRLGGMSDPAAAGEAVKQYGVRFGIEMCRAVLDSKRSCGLHFYTLNMDTVVDGILAGLNWVVQ